MRYITRFPLTKEEQLKKLCQRGPQIENGPILCNGHKVEVEQQPSERERGFVFIGSYDTHNS